MAGGDAQMEQIAAGLQTMREMLAADGYELKLEAGDPGVVLRVIAGPEACEECLVPKELFLSLVNQALDDAGVVHAGVPLRVVYPVDAHKE